ncbi:hypothetical protein [Lacticaseibacillus songhuajiangensis]|uniref:hypothetical protein n=1 Tax=Lacticaseibacillus songhuajiangensis TaxID=1296539 RepID=UPI000F7B5FB4|nr:hypothetical protein [Lacticaseibacillus songhuajiangensis]
MKTLTLACVNLRDFSRYVLYTWLGLFIFSDGLTFLFRLLLPKDAATFVIDGTLISPVAMILGICLAAHIRRYVDNGFAGGATRTQQWQALMVTVLVGGLLAEIGLALWSVQLRLGFINGNGIALLRDFGYRGPWNFGAVVSNVVFEWAFIMLVLSVALLIGVAVLYLPRGIWGRISAVLVLLAVILFPLRILLQHIAPSTSSAAVMTRRIINGSFTVYQGTAGTPYLGTALLVVTVAITLLLSWLCMRRAMVLR